MVVCSLRVGWHTLSPDPLVLQSGEQARMGLEGPGFDGPRVRRSNQSRNSGC